MAKPKDRFDQLLQAMVTQSAHALTLKELMLNAEVLRASQRYLPIAGFDS
jgi:hypothetical protein